MSFKIPSLKKAISKRNVAQDLHSFEYQEVELKEHIDYWKWSIWNSMEGAIQQRNYCCEKTQRSIG